MDHPVEQLLAEFPKPIRLLSSRPEWLQTLSILIGMPLFFLLLFLAKLLGPVANALYLLFPFWIPRSSIF